MTVIISPRAEIDLFDIWDYIANDSFKQADRMSGEFHRLFQLIALNPEMGRPRPELLDGLRSFRCGEYVIFFLSTSSDINIVRVLHRSRDLAFNF